MHVQIGPFVLVALAGWIHREQQDVIDYLKEESRVVREYWCGIFEERLHAWMRDSGVWPQRRSRDRLLEWFAIQVCGMVSD